MKTYRGLYAENLDAVQGMATLKAFNASRRRGAELHARAEHFSRDSIRVMGRLGAVGGSRRAGDPDRHRGGVFVIPTRFADPGRIVPGPDGNLWFTEQGAVGANGAFTPTHPDTGQDRSHHPIPEAADGLTCGEAIASSGSASAPHPGSMSQPATAGAPA